MFYVQNWVLASNAVDYYAEDDSLASPLQHFWSLSVQGQVFILWPLLFLFSAVVARRYRLKFRGVVLLVFGGLFVVSLAFSVWETSTSQAYAYFDTRARLWEFAFGTLLALALPSARLPRFLRVVAGWVGLVLMLGAGVVLDVQGQFPGYVALWPLTAAALVIIAGQTGSRFGADRFLASRPLVRVGNLSYALYLWHWPVLVLALVWQDRGSPGLVGGFLVIGVSLVLAHLTTRFVEQPMRALSWADRKRRRAVVVLAVCVALVAAPVAFWQQSLRVQTEQASARADTDNPGALSLLPGYVDEVAADAALLPELSDIRDDWPVFAGGCQSDVATAVNICDNSVGPEAPRSLMVVGSSHAHVWATPVLEVAAEEGWAVEAVTRGFCPLSLDPEVGSDCLAHNRDLIATVLERKPDVVVTTSTQTLPGGGEVLDPTWIGIIRQFSDAGIEVLAIRDTPRMPGNVRSCIEERGPDDPKCGNSRSATLADNSMPPDFGNDVPGLHLLDFSDFFCPSDRCPAVIGNVIVYKDDNHVTATYLKTMSQPFRASLPQSWF
ncbi:acyltransferase family protein [Arthrobacter sp. MDB2-24]